MQLKERIVKLRHHIFHDARGLFRRRKAYAGAAAVALIVLIGVIIFSTDHGGINPPTSHTPSVALASVAELSSRTTPLPLIGTVRSQSEATLRFERGGEVSRVNYTVGSFVPAGAVISELSNASEAAAVAQARASLEQAEAQLDKVRGGSREEQLTILAINVDTARSAYSSSRESAVNALLSAYAEVAEAIHQDADQVFSNARTSNVSFNLPTSDSGLVNQLVFERTKLQPLIDRQANVRESLSASSALEIELATTADELRVVLSFLDSLSLALTKSIPSQTHSSSDIDGFKADVTAARSSISGSLTSVTSALADLNTKQNALRVAEQNQEEGVSGERSEDVRSAEANVAQARASLASAVANLEKSRARTPISGTLSTLSVERGDFVSSFDLAAIVSNPNALEIKAFISERDKNDVSVGARVRINDTYSGTVTSVAPGVDPDTKKIAITVGITEADAELTHGSTVRLSVDRNPRDTERDNTMPFIVPITALKVETDRIVVFTVDEQGVLIAHEVTEGTLFGESVEIREGLTRDMKIVVDARGLSAGDTVILTDK